MVMASISSTDGRGLPTVSGSPSSLSGFPCIVTEVPGSTDCVVIFIFTSLVDAQAKMKDTSTKAKHTRAVRLIGHSFRDDPFIIRLFDRLDETL
jgi:hypothetical protein